MRVCDDAFALVGRTPLIRLAGIASGRAAAVWAKLELANPGGSVKDRPALSMVQAAEAEGRLGPGATLIEATSGNMGISLAMIAAVRGYRCVLVMPEDMSIERRRIMNAYGAEVELTPAAAGMAGAVGRAQALRDELPGAFMPSQFDNADNPASHEKTTGLEILEQTGGRLNAFVAGVGTGGTLTGVARVLRARLGSAVRIVAVEPASSAVLSGGTPAQHAIQGLGAGFVPRVLELELIDDVIAVSDSDARSMALRLARKHGLLVGPSSGANVAAACSVASELGTGDVVTVLCDSGERYLG
ncbi:MAG: cysteine synthase A [Polyangiaceae bacterium]|nr:cysteine synthase A [Polyangiaceae bacterium]